MAETYCGKVCAECAYKEQLSCPGCHTGPGRAWGSDCKLADCTRSKGHETCQTCGFRDRCGTLAGRERMPSDRIKRIEAEKTRAEAIARRAPFLGKWLWLMFWLLVPSLVASIVQTIPGLTLLGEFLTVACNLARCLILLKLSAEDDGYRTAGICMLISAVANFVVNLTPGSPESTGWRLIILIPAVIAGFVGTYREFMAHAAVLTGVDNDLSDKWEKLWKWYLGTLLGLLSSILLIIIAPVLAMLVVLAAAVGVIVVSILRLVYLYKTANVFRSCCETAV